MDTDEFKVKLEDLSVNIDELEDALAPLLKQDLTDITSKLPLLDKAKLNVLSTYAIESLLFSTLKLNGVNAKEHPVFTELSRVKQYFQKIKAAETKSQGASAASVTLDKAAANRFIKHALASNERNERPSQKIKFDDNVEEPPTAQPQAPSATTTETGRWKVGPGSPSSSSSSSEPDSDANDDKANTRSQHENKVETEANPQHQQQQPKLRYKRPGPDHDHDRGNISWGTRKKKTDKAPRDSSAVFQELLHRPAKKQRTKER